MQWSETGHESFLPHGRNVVIKRRRPGGAAQATEDESPWLSRLLHPLQSRHTRDLRRPEAAYERLAQRVEEIITGLGLIEEDFNISAGRIFHIPRVISVHSGPPVRVDIGILPGQSPEDFSAHAAAIAYDLGVAEVRIVALDPSTIRWELLPHGRLAG